MPLVNAHPQHVGPVGNWQPVTHLLGGTGFVVGFFGPLLIGLLIGSEPNQGPLWGIFILGPGGVILGAFVGAVIGFKKTRNR